MAPERRIALISVGAAVALIALKLGAGLASGSLGLLSEAAHSGTDLAAALLTFFAVGVAVRPADQGHPYGHGKAEHLAALAEATVLALVSIVIGGAAILRLVGDDPPELDLAWWTFAVIGLVIVIDASRAVVSWRAARRYSNAALATNAFHFASDLAGSTAVLIGLILAREGYPAGDSVAAIVVAVIVHRGRRAAHAAQRRRPHGSRARSTPRRPFARRSPAIDPPVELRRLRMRYAAGVPLRGRRHRRVGVGRRRPGPRGRGPGRGRGRARAARNRRRRARRADAARGARRARPRRRREGRGRARDPQRRHPRRRRPHGRLAPSEAPGELPLSEAHEVASAVEAAIRGGASGRRGGADPPGAARRGDGRRGGRATASSAPASRRS